MQGEGNVLAFGTLAYVQISYRACICFVAHPNRAAPKPESMSDDTVTSLMDEYLDSTREPVGSCNAFGELPSPARQTPPSKLKHDSSAAAMAILLVCITGVLVAALTYVLMR